MKKIVLIGVPSDLGANLEGSRHGPDALREVLLPALKKHKLVFEDRGNVPVPLRPQKTDPKKQNYTEIMQVRKHLEKMKLDLDKEFPIFMGGDHSVEDGIVALLTKKKDLGLMWFDAHADFNNVITSQESPWGGGHVHGMVLAEITGHALVHQGHEKPMIKDKNVALVGLRDVDPSEKKNLRKYHITRYSIKEVKEKGMAHAMEGSMKSVTDGTEGYHVTIDVDGLDPHIAPAVSTPVEEGISKGEIKKALSLLAAGPMTSIDFVEFNPRYDKNQKTAKLITELILHTVSSLEQNGHQFKRA